MNGTCLTVLAGLALLVFATSRRGDPARAVPLAGARSPARWDAADRSAAVTGALYDRIGVDYTRGRRPDPRWQSALDAVLGSAATVLNVGAAPAPTSPPTGTSWRSSRPAP